MTDIAAEIAALERFLAIQRCEVVPHCPHVPLPAQKRFLQLDTTEALYGGAAGGGKSDALLMGALRYVDIPGYAALLFRRTFSDLSLPGALIDRSRQWLTSVDHAHWNERDKKWTFDLGKGQTSTIQFGFCESPGDIYRYWGAELQYIGVDELTQWPEAPYRLLMSRLRRPKTGPLSTVPLRMRGATNPGGVGFQWVKDRFGLQSDGNQLDDWEEKDGDRVIRVTRQMRPFVPSRIQDNPHLDGEAYRSQLDLLDATTRDQLLLGLWVQDAAGRVYRFTRSRNLVSAVPQRMYWHSVLGLDLGASERKPTTAFTLCLWNDLDNVVYVESSRVQALLTPTDIARECERYMRERPDTQIVVDYGGLGTGYIGEFERRWGLPVIRAQKKNKLGYRKLLNGAFERGEIKLVEDQCKPLIKELETLVWDENGTDVAKHLDDHCSDALLYSWRHARAYASEAPAETPPIGTLAWQESEAKRLEMEDRERHRVRESEPSWERWCP